MTEDKAEIELKALHSMHPDREGYEKSEGEIKLTHAIKAASRGLRWEAESGAGAQSPLVGFHSLS